MNKQFKTYLLTFKLSLLLTACLNGQYSAAPKGLKHLELVSEDTLVSSKGCKAYTNLYIELLGQSTLGLYSLNYEKVFIKKYKPKYTLRGGVGYLPLEFSRPIRYYFSIPISASILFGKNHNYFELGAGTMWSYSQLWSYPQQEPRGLNQMISSLQFAYRYQSDKGPFIKIGWTPLILFSSESIETRFMLGAHPILPFMIGINAGRTFSSKNNL
jgi:hypothetical protein